MPAAPHVDPNDDPLKILARAERHFDQAIAAFQKMTDRLHAGGDITQTDADKTARALHAATQTLFTLKMRIDDERKRKDGIVGDYAIDLGDARNTVRSLLARLRSSGGPDGVS